MVTHENHIDNLIAKAANAGTADEAMKFSQAACNAANAVCAMVTAKKIPK